MLAAPVATSGSSGSPASSGTHTLELIVYVPENAVGSVALRAMKGGEGEGGGKGGLAAKRGAKLLWAKAKRGEVGQGRRKEEGGMYKVTAT